MMRGWALTTPCHDPGCPGEEVGTDCSILTGSSAGSASRARNPASLDDGVPVLLAATNGRGGPRVRGTLQRFRRRRGNRNQRSLSEGRVACANRHHGRMYTRNWGMWARGNLKIILGEPLRLPCPAVWALLLLALITGCREDLGERLQSGRVLAWHGLQGRWVGSGRPDRACLRRRDTGADVDRGKGFALDPFQSTDGGPWRGRR